MNRRRPNGGRSSRASRLTIRARQQQSAQDGANRHDTAVNDTEMEPISHVAMEVQDKAPQGATSCSQENIYIQSLSYKTSSRDQFRGVL